MNKKFLLMASLFISSAFILSGCNAESSKKKETVLSEIEKSTAYSIREYHIYNPYTIGSDNTGVATSWEIAESYTLDFYKTFSLEEKLQYLCNALAANCFGDLKIELVNIEDGIAQLNLVDSETRSWEEYNDPGNVGTYFYMTFDRNLLDQDIEGEWIKGYSLYHNGEEYRM